MNVPAELTDVIEGVFGLDNRRQAAPLYRKVIGPAQNITPLTPPQVATLYGFPSGPAAGQCVGVLEFGGGYQTSDINSFFSGLGLPAPALTTVGVDGAVNSPGSDADTSREGDSSHVAIGT